MTNAIRQKTRTQMGGKLEIFSPELPDDTPVEVIVFLLPEDEQDMTDYLLSTEANRQHLLEAITPLEKRENLITFTPAEWHERYCL